MESLSAHRLSLTTSRNAYRRTDYHAPGTAHNMHTPRTAHRTPHVTQREMRTATMQPLNHATTQPCNHSTMQPLNDDNEKTENGDNMALVQIFDKNVYIIHHFTSRSRCISSLIRNYLFFSEVRTDRQKEKSINRLSIVKAPKVKD